MITNSKNAPQHRVSLFIDRTAGQASGYLEGIGDALDLHRSWRLCRYDHIFSNLGFVERFNPDGVIGMPRNIKSAKRLLALQVPLVDVMGRVDQVDMPTVAPDYEMIGQMQAAYMMERGHTNLWIIGRENYRDNQKMIAGATAEAEAAGLDIQRLDLDPLYKANNSETDLVDQALTPLISRIPTPAAVLTLNARDAERVSQSCLELGIAIPDDISIITMNDDGVSNSLSHPRFTTVDLPWRKIGRTAAEWLKAYLEGKPVDPTEKLLFAPVGITERRSTESIAVADPQLSKAVAFIREHAGEKITVPEVAEAAGISRRLLEQRFRKSLGRSPFQEIRYQQIQYVREMLLETNLTMEEICEQSAFTYISHLSKAFREEYGIPPGQYRSRGVEELGPPKPVR